MNSKSQEDRVPDARIAAEFPTEDDARSAVRALSDDSTLASTQTEIIDPQDPMVDHRHDCLQPSVVQTLMHDHLLFAAGGVGAGLFVAWCLVTISPSLITAHTHLIFSGFAVIGAAVGIMLAGPLTAGHGQDSLATQAVNAARQGHWLVIARTRGRTARKRAISVLNSQAHLGRVTHSH